MQRAGTADPKARSALWIASARLPVAVSRGATGESDLTTEGGVSAGVFQARPSPGGLATALRSVAGQRPFTWVGWPGAAVPPDQQDEVEARLGELGGLVPIFADREEVEGWYEELSNRVLWPLFHALPTPINV